MIYGIEGIAKLGQIFFTSPPTVIFQKEEKKIFNFWKLFFYFIRVL